MNSHLCTQIDYMYRDPNNFKFHGYFTVKGTVTEGDLKPYMFDGVLFAPEKIGLDHLLTMPMNSYDHILHELTAFQVLESTKFDFTAGDLIEQFKAHSQEGWF